MTLLVMRRGNKGDADALRAIATEAYAEYISLMGRKPLPMLADYEQQLREDEVRILHDEESGAIAGFVVIQLREGRYWLENIAVAQAYRNNGLGRRLLDFTEELLVGRTDACYLYTNVVMTRNVEWYRSRGYEEMRVGEEDGYNRVFFKKNLSAP